MANLMKSIKSLSFRQYKCLGALIDANGGIYPSQSKMKLQDFLVLERRGLAICNAHFGRKVFGLVPNFGIDELEIYQNIAFETECCGALGNHEFVADGYVKCLSCDDTHAKLKMVK